MSFGINVKGGTNASWRRVKEKPPWTCACPKDQPGHRYSCASCGTRRPA